MSQKTYFYMHREAVRFTWSVMSYTVNCEDIQSASRGFAIFAPAQSEFENDTDNAVKLNSAHSCNMCSVAHVFSQ